MFTKSEQHRNDVPTLHASIAMTSKRRFNDGVCLHAKGEFSKQAAYYSFIRIQDLTATLCVPSRVPFNPEFLKWTLLSLHLGTFMAAKGESYKSRTEW